jgi:hypothetical protein
VSKSPIDVGVVGDGANASKVSKKYLRKLICAEIDLSSLEGRKVRKNMVVCRLRYVLGFTRLSTSTSAKRAKL